MKSVMIRLRRNEPRALEHILRWNRLVVILSLILPVGPGVAQPVRAPEAPIRFHHLGVEDGLSHPDVHAIYQDRLGFLWFGTEDGLNRYDGTHLQSYRPVPFDTTSLAGAWVVDIAANGEEPGFWLAGERGTLSRYHPTVDAFTRHTNALGSSLTETNWKLLRAGEGVLWLGGRVSGLVRYDPVTGALTRYQHQPDDPHSLSSSLITALLEDRHGHLWIGTQTGGLNRLDPATERITHYRNVPGDPATLPTDYVLSLLEDRAGRLWIGTDQGLAHYDAEADAFVPHPGLTEAAWSLLEDPVGILWVGTDRGLVRFDPAVGTTTRYRHDPLDPTSMTPGLVRTLFLDRSGVLWLGTENGLSAFEWAPPPFAAFGHDPADPESLDDPGVWSFLVDPDGVLWVGTEGGLNRIDRETGRVTHYRHDPADPNSLLPGWVMSLHEAPGSTFWVGTRRHSTRPGALHRFDPATGRVMERYVMDPENPRSLPTDNPWNLFEDSRERFWVLAGGGCLSEMDRAHGTFTPYCPDPNNPNTPAGSAKNVVEHPAGVFWLGTWGGGLDRFDTHTGRFTHYPHDPANPASPANDYILSLHGGADGVLWLGYYGAGFSRFDAETGVFTHYNSANSALPNDVVYAIEEDNAGHLWLSTNRGLTRFTYDEERFENFGLDDGLQDLEFNAGASYRAPSGELFFGGINGFNHFFPNRLNKNPIPPPVVLTGFLVNGKPVTPGQRAPLEVAAPLAEVLRLAPNQRDVAITFAALHYANPARNRYRYRMEGYDEAWREPGSEHTATYTNLDPGTYTFRVQAANSDGVWNEEGVVLTLTVAPFFYETWWFLALCGLAVAGLLAAAYGNRIRQLRRNEQALETQVAKRTRALRAEKQKTEAQAERLREMDRLKSRFFTNVSHEFRTPLTLTIGPLEDLQANDALSDASQQQVDLALRNSRRLLRLINQVLDIARLEAGEMRLKARKQDLAAFLHGLTLSFTALAERRRIRFDVQVPATPVPVYFETNKLEQVFVNLLSNAFKFTPQGGAILIRMDERRYGGVGESAAHESSTQDCVEIAVRDNGPGIPPEDLPHLFERFYQVDEAHAALQTGSGIGLSLAKDLAALHGGTIAVESIIGFGATFTVTLPLGRTHLRDAEIDEAHAMPPDMQPARSVALPGDGEATDLPVPVVDQKEAEDDRTTVLVVDDNADIRAYVGRHLEAHYRVLEAADGARALDMARAALPDLIVSDVMMPELDGFGLVRALKADRETDFVPVILLTAKATAEDRIEGLEEGADDYLTKPFSIRELQARIDNLIASRRKLKKRFAATPLGLSVSVVADEARSVSDTLFLERVRTAVEAHLSDEDFTVEDLAAAVEQSRSNLHRRLRELLDQSPTTFIRSVRLEHAAALFVEQRGSVSEVAYGVGFKSVSHFSQTFRKRYGVSPSAYLDHQSTTPPAYG